MEEICSAEMSIHFQQTTLRDIPEDRTLQNNLRENLKSYKISCVLSINFNVYLLCYFYWVSEVNVVNNGLDIGLWIWWVTDDTYRILMQKLIET
jgi:hypothetical protein